MGKCVDCKYWLQTWTCLGERLDTGWCQNDRIHALNDTDIKEDEAGMLVKYWNCNFKCGKHFGCIHFVQKDIK